MITQGQLNTGYSMSTLHSELKRLYFLPDQHGYGPCCDLDDGSYGPDLGVLTPEVLAPSLAGGNRVAINLVSSAGTVRTLAICFEKGADWEQVAKLYAGTQAMALPAPALAVSGISGYQLWFSLVDPIPVVQAQQFFYGLSRQYLADTALCRLRCCPDIPGIDNSLSCLIDLVPAFQEATQRWSAFIDPGLGSLFIDEPGLEMVPNMAGQADILAGVDSIKAGDFQRALSRLQVADSSDAQIPERSSGMTGEGAGAHHMTGHQYRDPESFLMVVMNDPACHLTHRIEAAKALLPYIKKTPNP